MSKASAAFTSPLGGIKGGEYCGRRGRREERGEAVVRASGTEEEEQINRESRGGAEVSTRTADN